MAFQPYGYRFDVQSPLAPADVKKTVSAGMKRWFDPKSGARGWIIGPFICLWFSAFDQYGPMLFGRIAQHEAGTRITGRAGSDLNGLALFTLLVPAMMVLSYHMISAGELGSRQVMFLGGILLLTPLIFWVSHKDRRDAEPLVRFLREAVRQGRSRRSRPEMNEAWKRLSLQIDGEKQDDSVTPDKICEALAGMGPHGFVILESGHEAYIQTAFRDGGYILEMREGAAHRHYRAVRKQGEVGAGGYSIFDFEESLAIFTAYASDAPTVEFLMWERMALPE